ncbi:hypothetical protein [Kitasatospora sp. NPDC051914]|uniref:hypothetical protein n=1 Tax=Kitasatospora sp. NPDC051914 TaxID=3154945 RepID=UPI00342B549D
MKALAYEVRRLRSVRSTWLTAAVVLLSGAAVAVVMARQQPGPSPADAVRAVTAVVPVLPSPVAALGAGVLGALSYAHEVSHPGLPASRVALPRRLGLLTAKLLVVGAVCLALSAATALLNGSVFALALPPGTDARELLDPGAQAGAVRPLALFAVLVVLSGWAGLLATCLVRNAAAGLALLTALAVLGEPLAGLLLRRTDPDGVAALPAVREVQDLLPFENALERLRLGDGRVAAEAVHLPVPVLLAMVLAPPALGLLGAVAVQFRRRAL